MNQIGTVKFDFSMQNEEFARELYSRWDKFFMQNFEQIADELLTRHAVPSEYIEIKQLDIQIGTLSEEELDEKFPLILREKMEEALLKCLQNPHQTQTFVKQISNTENACEVLFYFLLHGILPWNASKRHRNINELFMEVLQSNPAKLKQFLQTYGHYTSLRERLIYQLGNPELKAGVTLLKSSESTFICSYIQFLINQYKELEQPSIPPTEHRYLVWKVTYVYLLDNASSYFNKKSFLEYTITHLATGHNVTYDYLLNIITAGLDKYTSEIPSSSGLYAILKELKEELTEKQWKITPSNISELCNIVLDKLRQKGKKEWSNKEIASLKRILANPQSCKLLLQLATPKEIEKLLCIVIPKEKEFILSCFQLFEQLNNTEIQLGMTNWEFSKIQWEIIFSILAQFPESNFNHRYFIFALLNEIAKKSKIKIDKILLYFSENKKTGLNTELIQIINQLKIEKTKGTVFQKETQSNNIIQKTDKTIKYSTMQNENEVLYINNAGLVLLNPFLPRLFTMLSYTENGKFKGREEQIRAIFLMQFLVFGNDKKTQPEYPEHELLLNKTLVAWENEKPIPRSIELKEEELSTAESLLKAVLQHWSKLKNTSLAGLREGFLQREGKLEFRENDMLLTVESKAYDMLLDSIPWSYNLIKFPWMKQAVHVKWR